MIEIHFIMAFFSNFVAFGEKKLINLVFTLTLVLILEKRAANLIRMRKIAFSTKIRPLDRALFSTKLLWDRKKLIDLVLTFTLNFIFEKRAANLIRMRKIAITTLKSAFGF